MTFFRVVGILGQLAVIAMAGIIVLAALTVMAGMLYPALVAGLVH